MTRKVCRRNFEQDYVFVVVYISERKEVCLVIYISLRGSMFEFFFSQVETINCDLAVKIACKH